ncbi:hypothetical protein V8C42DRAFT_336903 [Trichoderma barbatum]
MPSSILLFMRQLLDFFLIMSSSILLFMHQLLDFFLIMPSSILIIHASSSGFLYLLTLQHSLYS